MKKAFQRLTFLYLHQKSFLYPSQQSAKINIQIISPVSLEKFAKARQTASFPWFFPQSFKELNFPSPSPLPIFLCKPHFIIVSANLYTAKRKILCHSWAIGIEKWVLSLWKILWPYEANMVFKWEETSCGRRHPQPNNHNNKGFLIPQLFPTEGLLQ